MLNIKLRNLIEILSLHSKVSLLLIQIKLKYILVSLISNEINNIKYCIEKW